jgi:4-amino-4-deoxychorismate lyase
MSKVKRTSPLVESIAVKDGVIQNLKWHKKRYAASYSSWYEESPNSQLLDELDIELPNKGYFKLRIEYTPDSKSYTIQPYHTKEISSLKMVEDNDIDYSVKFADRTAIDMLLEMCGECDDILIIKNGAVSDTSAGNILFFDGQAWFTPDTPLLQGTQRAHLIDKQLIMERSIRIGDIHSFIGFQVINAMRPFDSTHYENISHIL